MTRPGTSQEPLRLLDLHPPAGDFLQDVLDGLRADEKWISSMYFYDAHGSSLFDRITELPEYYLTRTELSILADFMPEMADRIGPRACVIEPGAGSGLKTRRLLAGLIDPVAYVPVEISRGHLLEAAGVLASEFPELEVLPVCADFTRPFHRPEPSRSPARNVLFFPGSTIGNFDPASALELLRAMHADAEEDGCLLIGVDLRKDADTLILAYDDPGGVTAEFNLNLLRRINRELGADFDVDAFRHQADWNDAAGRIEMRLISRARQTVTIAGNRFEFEPDEPILTEYSHKYDLDEFATLAGSAGFAVEHVWTDPDRQFSLQFLTRS